MGVVIYLLYHGIMRFFPHNSIVTIFTVLVGILVYGVSLILTRALSEEELYQLPKGALIVSLCRRLHLM